MSEGFDAAGYLSIDIQKGDMRTRDGGDRRHVAVPIDLLSSLARAAGDREGGGATMYAAGRTWGEVLGQAIAGDLIGGGASLSELSPQNLSDRLAGALGAMGWGHAAIETWGPGLVVAMSGMPGDGHERHLLAGVLAGVVSSVSGRQFACAVVDKGLPPGESRFFLGAPKAVKAARRWHADTGASVGEIVAKLLAGHKEGA
jgi:hypothetical protein